MYLINCTGLCGLRIDNCDERLVYKNGDIFGTKGDTHACNISPKTPEFVLTNDGVNLLIRLGLKEKIIFNLLFHFYFLIQDFSLNMPLINLKLYQLIDTEKMEETVSQNFYLGPGHSFM